MATKTPKQISLDELNMHLFDTIEMLKNNNDPNASANEKIDVETARTIASLGKVVVEGYRVKAQVLEMMSNAQNPTAVTKTLSDGGFINGQESIGS